MDASLFEVEMLVDVSSLEVETMMMLKMVEALMMIEHPDELEEEQLCSYLQVGGQLAAVCPG